MIPHDEITKGYYWVISKVWNYKKPLVVSITKHSRNLEPLVWVTGNECEQDVEDFDFIERIEPPSEEAGS